MSNGVENKGQEVIDLVEFVGDGGTVKYYAHRAAAQFLVFSHNLTAGSTGRGRLVNKFAVLPAGRNGYTHLRNAVILYIGREHRRPLRAQAGGKGGIFLIGSLDYHAISQTQRGSYAKLGIR